MHATRLCMGMPITVDVVDASVSALTIEDVFAYFAYIDHIFSTYKDRSEISAFNRGEISPDALSEDMKTVLRLSEETKQVTGGYFDIRRDDGTLDPSGLVKGWAINNAAILLRKSGCRDFYINAGGDVATSGQNADGRRWGVGIRDPFGSGATVVQVVFLKDRGMATSGTYIRGQHIYNPHGRSTRLTEVVSLTVIGPDVYEADRFATAAFAMGRDGMTFIETRLGLEGYAIDKNGMATFTSGFESYTRPYG